MTARQRILGTVGALVLASTSVLMTTGGAALAVAPAADVITFTSHVYLGPVMPGQPRRFTIVGDTCQLVADGGSAESCTIVISGTVVPGGGQARGVITSATRVITLDETFRFTGPTTSAGTGSAIEVDRVASKTSFGTFTANFTTSPTPNPNVLLDVGTITVDA